MAAQEPRRSVVPQRLPALRHPPAWAIPVQAALKPLRQSANNPRMQSIHLQRMDGSWQFGRSAADLWLYCLGKRRWQGRQMRWVSGGGTPAHPRPAGAHPHSTQTVPSLLFLQEHRCRDRAVPQRLARKAGQLLVRHPPAAPGPWILESSAAPGLHRGRAAALMPVPVLHAVWQDPFRGWTAAARWLGCQHVHGR